MISGGPRIIQNGLIWMVDPADAGSYRSGSSIIYNMISSDGHGTIVNLPITTSNCTVFSGSGTGYINCGSGSVSAFSSSQFSYGGWVYYDGITKAKAIFGRRNDSPYNQYNLGQYDDILMGTVGNNLCSFNCPEGGGPPYVYWNYSVTGSGIGWYYIVTTMNINSHNFYVNGVSVASSTTNYSGRTFLIPNQNLYVGAINSLGVPASMWDSFLGPFHLYNRPLTPSEVLQNYNVLKGRFSRP